MPNSVPAMDAMIEKATSRAMHILQPLFSLRPVRPDLAAK
jgi:hypothetical protein